MARPKKKEEMVRLPASTNLLPATLEVLDRLSLQLDRSRSYLIEKFTLRGFAAYQRDGLLDEPAATVAQGEMLVVRQPRTTEKATPKQKTGT